MHFGFCVQNFPNCCNSGYLRVTIFFKVPENFICSMADGLVNVLFNCKPTVYRSYLQTKAINYRPRRRRCRERELASVIHAPLGLPAAAGLPAGDGRTAVHRRGCRTTAHCRRSPRRARSTLPSTHRVSPSTFSPRSL